MATKIGLCVVILNLAIIHSFELDTIENIHEDQLVAKIEKILNENVNRNVEIHKAVRGKRKDIHDAHKQRKRLIKTIVPHGHVINFQTNGDAVYKTLIRIHKKKKPTFEENDEYKTKFDSIAQEKRGRPDLGDFGLGIARTDLKLNKTYDFSTFWQHLKALKDKHKEKETTLEDLKVPEAKHLRQSQWTAETKSPITRPPLNHFWNYWTYDRTIPQYRCNGTQIRFNNKCISVS